MRRKRLVVATTIAASVLAMTAGATTAQASPDSGPLCRAEDDAPVYNENHDWIYTIPKGHDMRVHTWPVKWDYFHAYGHGEGHSTDGYARLSHFVIGSGRTHSMRVGIGRCEYDHPRLS